MRLIATLLLPGLAMLSFPVEPAGAAASASDDDKLICKYRQKTGTRFRAKECKTAAAWEAMAEAHRAGLKETVDRPQIEIRRN
jgi:hypothetical protein